jgi:hypothetical protein
VARKGRSILRRLVREPAAREAVDGLAPEHFLLKSVTDRRRAKALVVVGGDDAGVLYGAYRLAERLGVRFYLHGDVVPDARMAPSLADLPDLDERGAPLFKTRGINPFHDFPEGPDWWDEGDYLAYVAQLAKMRMNFIGLHCYPEGGVGPEPAVWIGLPSDVGPDGRVGFAYPSQWANTARNGMWGYSSMKTADFCAGASGLFASDDFGPEVMEGLMPRPGTPEDSARLFDRTGVMYGRAFARARSLGVKTCIGTETPLTVPKAVKERLKAQGKDFRDAAVVRERHRRRRQGGARRARGSGRPLHPRDVRLGSRAPTRPRGPGRGPPEDEPHELHQPEGRARAGRARLRERRGPAALGDPLDGKRPQHGRAPAVGRADAP